MNANSNRETVKENRENGHRKVIKKACQFLFCGNPVKHHLALFFLVSCIIALVHFVYTYLLSEGHLFDIEHVDVCHSDCGEL